MRVGQVRTYRQSLLGLGQTAFIIALSIERISEARSPLRIGTIERDRPARQCLGRTQRFLETSPLIVSRLALSPGETLVAPGKARIEVDSLLKKFLRESVVLRGGLT